jgi:hypothetical protein
VGWYLVKGEQAVDDLSWWSCIMKREEKMGKREKKLRDEVLDLSEYVSPSAEGPIR